MHARPGVPTVVGSRIGRIVMGCLVGGLLVTAVNKELLMLPYVVGLVLSSSPHEPRLDDP